MALLSKIDRIVEQLVKGEEISPEDLELLRKARPQGYGDAVHPPIDVVAKKPVSPKVPGQGDPSPDLLQSVGEATGIKTTSPKGQSRKIGQPSIYQTTGGFKQMELPGFGDVPFDPSNPKRPFRTGLTSSVDPEEFVSKIVRKGAQGQAITMTEMDLVEQMTVADDNMVKKLLGDGKITQGEINKYRVYMKERVFPKTGPHLQPDLTPPSTEGLPEGEFIPGFDKPKTPDSFDGDLDFGSIMRRMLFQIGTAGVGAAIGGIAGGKQGALAGAGIGSKLAGQAMGIHDQLKQRGIANEINRTKAEASKIAAEAAKARESGKPVKDPILDGTLSQIDKTQDPRARLQIIEGMSEAHRIDPRVIAAKTRAEAELGIFRTGLEPTSRANIEEMVASGQMTQEEGDRRLAELEGTRTRAIQRDIAETEKIIGAKAAEKEKQATEQGKTLLAERRNLFNLVANNTITGTDAFREYNGRVRELTGKDMDQGDAEAILDSWVAFDTKVKLEGDSKTRAGRSMALQLTTATLIERLADPDVQAALGRYEGSKNLIEAWVTGKAETPPAVLEVMQLLGMATEGISRIQSGAALTETEVAFFRGLVGTATTDAKANMQQAAGLQRMIDDAITGEYRLALISKGLGPELSEEHLATIPTFANSYPERAARIEQLLQASGSAIGTTGTITVTEDEREKARRKLEELRRNRGQ